MSHTYESLKVGDTFTMQRTISSRDVEMFAHLTGDDNPIHLDEDFAAKSRFGTRVVHGALLVGYISKLLGRDFPGPGSIAVSLSARFLRPTPVGSDVTFEAKIAEKTDARKHVKARVYAYVDGKMVMGGDAIIIPPTEESD